MNEAYAYALLVYLDTHYSHIYIYIYILYMIKYILILQFVVKIEIILLWKS